MVWRKGKNRKGESQSNSDRNDGTKIFDQK